MSSGVLETTEAGVPGTTDRGVWGTIDTVDAGVDGGGKSRFGAYPKPRCCTDVHLTNNIMGLVKANPDKKWTIAAVVSLPPRVIYHASLLSGLSNCRDWNGTLQGVEGTRKSYNAKRVGISWYDMHAIKKLGQL